MPRHNLYEKTRKLEETLTQFMQVSLSIRKSIEASIKVWNSELVSMPTKWLRKTLNISANMDENPKSSKIEKEILKSSIKCQARDIKEVLLVRQPKNFKHLHHQKYGCRRKNHLNELTTHCNDLTSFTFMCWDCTYSLWWRGISP